MDDLQKQDPHGHNENTSFDPPDDPTGSGGGKTAGSASAGETSFDPPDDPTGSGGGKTAGSASGREH